MNRSLECAACPESNENIVVNNKLNRIWKEAIEPSFGYNVSISPAATKEDHEILSQETPLAFFF